MNTSQAVLQNYGGFTVARDDLLPGGTKSRYLGVLFDGVEQVVYASPAQGAAQIALAAVGQQLGKQAVIFVAERAETHQNTSLAMKYGAIIEQVNPGYLNVVQARARAYVARKAGARLAPFGLRIPEAAQCLREVCAQIALDFDEVWCAAGSGTLAEALSQAFPNARIFAVSVGHNIKDGEAGRAKILRYDRPFDRPARVVPPFPCNITYDAKAWEIMIQTSHSKRALFWNVDKDHGTDS